jgi:hypothetical protein
MRLVRDRAGATPSDVLIFLATVSLAAALLYPAWSARGFRDRVTQAAADVEAVASGARAALGSTGAWPQPMQPGQAPPELLGLSREGGPFSRLGYTLGWTAWNVVDSTLAPVDVVNAIGDAPPDSVGPVMRPAIRTVGGIALYSNDASLLAELAQQYAEETSFVLDTMWMLVLPERADGPAGVP